MNDAIMVVCPNCGAQHAVSEALFEAVVCRKLAEKTEGIRTDAARGERERLQLEIAAKDEILKKNRAELGKAREVELRLRADRESLEDERRNFELTAARTLDAERTRIRELARKEVDERH